MFDGDKINLTATPDSLGMDDEDIIEVLAKKNWLNMPSYEILVCNCEFSILMFGMRDEVLNFYICELPKHSFLGFVGMIHQTLLYAYIKIDQ